VLEGVVEHDEIVVALVLFEGLPENRCSARRPVYLAREIEVKAKDVMRARFAH
jgi:hypothetical protein